MFDNVPERFIPEDAPETLYANPDIDYALNRSDFNATRELLDRGIAENEWGDRTAIVSLGTGEELTYVELKSRVDRFAGALRDLGVEPGDRILWRFGEVPAAHVVQLAAWKVGAVSVSCAMPESAREIEYFINDTEARLVVCSGDDFGEVETALENTPSVENVVVRSDVEGYHSFEELLDTTDPDDEFAETGPLDASSIFYTGGTTGKPKGCIHAHAAEVAMADLEAGTGRATTADDVMFSAAPLGHAFGNGEKINFPIRHGARTVLAPGAGPTDWVDIVEEHDVSIFVGAPTMLRMMLQKTDLEERDLSSVRLVVMSGEMFDPQTFEEWRRVTGIENTCNVVGMSPMRHIFLTSYRDGEKVAPGLSVGKPYAGYEAKVVEIDDPDEELERGETGRLAIRGPTTITYWNNIHPDMPGRMGDDSNGPWALLDDAYYRDEDGWLHFETRLDNMIVTGGRQIAAPDVESVLNDHPAVAESAVVGKPDETRGELVKAFVVVEPEATPDADLVAELQDHCKSNMAKYKYPREIEFLSELPKDQVGKIQRAELRDRAR